MSLFTQWLVVVFSCTAALLLFLCLVNIISDYRQFKRTGQRERQTDIPINLESAIRWIAREKRLKVRFDTHYDARNCEISWIDDKILFRLDFQPTASNSTHVTMYRDHYRFFTKMLSWADNYIPYFAYMTPLYRKIDYRVLRDLSNYESVDYYIQAVRECTENNA
jgi:hypothetical protein